MIIFVCLLGIAFFAFVLFGPTYDNRSAIRKAFAVQDEIHRNAPVLSVKAKVVDKLHDSSYEEHGYVNTTQQYNSYTNTVTPNVRGYTSGSTVHNYSLVFELATGGRLAMSVPFKAYAETMVGDAGILRYKDIKSYAESVLHDDAVLEYFKNPAFDSFCVA